MRIDENGVIYFTNDIVDANTAPSGDYSHNPSYEPESFETNLSKKIAEFDMDDWKLILVNKDNPLEADIECELKKFDGFEVDERIYDELKEMFSDAEKEGIYLNMASGYRNYNTQNYLYNKKVNYFKRLGFSKEEAEETASMKVTPPMTSEHQTGLAVDILSDDHYKMDAEFGESDAGIWLSEHSYEYGFILRYPEGCEEITKIQYEPWHFRYVGKDAAEFIYINNLTFEEFAEMVNTRNNSN
ncbi:MAG: M15 family metallopeptidase [Lachnospiraceae bacterium]|nr:M15 family metallopeptidase [Lachnospiraceae bacterium]